MTQSVNNYGAIIKECSRFAKKEICDQALDADFISNSKWLTSIWTKSMAVDLPLLPIPEKFNGVGESELCCAIILDLLASDCAGIASAFAFHYAGCIPIIEDQKTNGLSAITNADPKKPVIATIIFPSDYDDCQIKIKEKKGKLYLSGTSGLTGNAGHANIFTVFVQDGASPDEITCIMIHKDTAGFSMGKPGRLPGLKVNPFQKLIFNDAWIDTDAIIGQRKKGRSLMEKTQNSFNGFIAAMAMGMIRTAHKKALEYAGKRYQSGEMIIHHSEMQRMLGNMVTKLSVGTSAYLRVFNEDKLDLPYASADGSAAKIFCTDSALEATSDAIQILGGYGYMHEYGMEKLMRDSKVLNLLGGSSPNLNVKQIAKNIQKAA